jgi:hypothetical protein
LSGCFLPAASFTRCREDVPKPAEENPVISVTSSRHLSKGEEWNVKILAKKFAAEILLFVKMEAVREYSGFDSGSRFL